MNVSREQGNKLIFENKALFYSLENLVLEDNSYSAKAKLKDKLYQIFAMARDAITESSWVLFQKRTLQRK